mmetsp:Transcript_909/g.2580  ORF Transcript_909/g.2580 Transcript_909/m.2580 type:complete len:324 (-) Transcript_909:15-986(-)
MRRERRFRDENRRSRHDRPNRDPRPAGRRDRRSSASCRSRERRTQKDLRRRHRRVHASKGRRLPKSRGTPRRPARRHRTAPRRAPAHRLPRRHGRQPRQHRLRSRLEESRRPLRPRGFGRPAHSVQSGDAASGARDGAVHGRRAGAGPVLRSGCGRRGHLTSVHLRGGGPVPGVHAQQGRHERHFVGRRRLRPGLARHRGRRPRLLRLEAPRHLLRAHDDLDPRPRHRRPRRLDRTPRPRRPRRRRRQGPPRRPRQRRHPRRPHRRRPRQGPRLRRPRPEPRRPPRPRHRRHPKGPHAPPRPLPPRPKVGRFVAGWWEFLLSR